MSKADLLLKKAVFFERMAVYSDRKVFLQSLAQGEGLDYGSDHPYTDAEIKSALEAVNDAIQNWVSHYGIVQNAPSSPRMLPKSLQGPANDLANAAKYNQFNNQLLTTIYQQLRALSAVVTFQDMDNSGKKAWINIVFPSSTHAMDIVDKSLKSGGTKPVAPKDSGPAFPGMGLKQMNAPAVKE